MPFGQVLQLDVSSNLYRGGLWVVVTRCGVLPGTLQPSVTTVLPSFYRRLRSRPGCTVAALLI